MGTPVVKDNENSPPIILIVDDNIQNVELLQAYLEELDCDMIPAYDGPEALDIVARRRPDLVLLDIMMPKMSGFDVCKRLKSNPKNCNIPVIMITALNEFGDIQRGIDAGTDDFVSKPVNKLELIARVRTMLRFKHVSDKLERTLAYLNEIENATKIESQ